MRYFRLMMLLLTICWTTGGRAFAEDGLPQPGAAGPQPGAAAPTDDATYRQQIGYMLGQNVGTDLRENGIQCDLESFFAGVRDALQGAEPKWTETDLAATMERFDREMREKAAARMQELQQTAEKNAREARAFLAENRKRDGVLVTASGLQYRVVNQGNGPSPTPTDVVRCHYRGTLIDGTEFDSSIGGEPATFPVRGVIAGWTEALQKMRVGDKWQLFIPADLAYGPEPRGPHIGPNSLLIFELELVGIESR